MFTRDLSTAPFGVQLAPKFDVIADVRRPCGEKPSELVSQRTKLSHSIRGQRVRLACQSSLPKSFD